jgi:peptidoglycan hydrolase CwlO-like protein
MNNSNIHNLLTVWGSSQRQLPEHNQTLKNHVLAYPLTPSVKISHNTLRLPWSSFVFAAMAVVALIVALPKNSTSPVVPDYQSLTSGQAVVSSLAQPMANSAPSAAANSPVRSENLKSKSTNDVYSQRTHELPETQNIPANDSREFLKTDYSANVQTRDVQKMATTLQTTVKGFDGRVDSISSSQDQGYVSFVIPASQLDAFKMQIKDIAGGAKFYTEQTSSENLLEQKVSIEDQQKQTNDQLTQLTSGRDQLTADHNKAVASLRSQIASLNSQLQTLNGKIPTTPGEAMQIDAQKQDLQNKIQNLKTSLANENSNYNDQLDSFNYQISDTQSTLGQLSQQTTTLLNTVATVRGTINISYISFWAMIGLYLNGYLIAGLLLLAAIISYFVGRRPTSLVDIIV